MSTYYIGIDSMAYLLLLSPAKKQQHEYPDFAVSGTKSRLLDSSAGLIKKLQKLSPDQLSKALGISQKLGELNYERYQDYDLASYTKSNSCPAMYTFAGDVYRALDALSLDAKQVDFAQQHLRILSGLYGVLRPLDKIKFHRLEMGSGFPAPDGSSLYDYWSEPVSNLLQSDLGKTGVIVNCASNEYVKAVTKSKFAGRWIDINFKQQRDGKLKSIGILAKRARGQIARFAVTNVVKDYHGLLNFNQDGYNFDQDLSSDNEWVFVSDAV